MNNLLTKVSQAIDIEKQNSEEKPKNQTNGEVSDNVIGNYNFHLNMKKRLSELAWIWL